MQDPPTLMAKPALLSAAELRFFQVLRKAVGRKYVIAAKVRLADLINCDGARWEAYGKRFSGMHVDFVLLRPKDTGVVACIELDDRSHNTGSSWNRDKEKINALYEAAIPLVRILARRTYNKNEIKKAIREAIRETVSRSRL